MKTNCITYVTEAHQLALPNFVANTKSVFNPDAKGIGGESTVILSKGSNRVKAREATTTNMELSATIQQCNQQHKQSTKRKRKRTTQVAIAQGSKDGEKSAATDATAEPSAGLQQYDQQPNHSTKHKRKTQSGSQPSVMSDNAFSPSRETKTDTRRKLPETVKKRLSKFLRDKESLKKAQKEIMATILDYAGHPVFYATHYLCLSKAGIYYIVFDASQPLDGKAPSVFHVRKGEIIHIPLFDDETNFDRLLDWMSAIHIMEPDHSHHIILFDEEGIVSSAMFLVGTHADKLREQPGLMKRQDEFMKKKLEGTVLAKHIIWASKDNENVFLRG